MEELKTKFKVWHPLNLQISSHPIQKKINIMNPPTTNFENVNTEMCLAKQ